MQAQQGGAPAQQTGTGGDALDKGVDSILKKAGKGQSASTKTSLRRPSHNLKSIEVTEKISDVIR
ncbi:BQ2448_5651 [Microbotryum intermedium]|uniref:BQ2448_5651 protein n=1 Tax=Microbotryum intermedium TaxID=269621 RepID=A0A238F1W4_9BASI|nr:BQ2448_5651 [Microbotryum intermedium]